MFAVVISPGRQVSVRRGRGKCPKFKFTVPAQGYSVSRVARDSAG